MSYHCCFGDSLRTIGVSPRRAHITCDGCGKVREVSFAGGLPPMWLLKGKAAPGWALGRMGRGQLRKDYCAECHVGGLGARHEDPVKPKKKVAP